MVVLALETVTPAGSLGLWHERSGGAVLSQAGDPSAPHAARLPVAIVEFLRAHALGLEDVTRMAVVIGPGSFTGVRIGVACAQGFAATRGWQIAAVPTLDALAEGWRHRHSDAAPGAVVRPCLDGMRGEVFTAAYRWDGTTMTAVSDPEVGAPSREWGLTSEAPVCIVGNGAVRYADLWRGTPVEVSDALEPLAASAARLAASPGWPVVGPHALRPVYVRRPDVELARERRARQG